MGSTVFVYYTQILPDGTRVQHRCLSGLYAIEISKPRAHKPLQPFRTRLAAEAPTGEPPLHPERSPTRRVAPRPQRFVDRLASLNYPYGMSRCPFMSDMDPVRSEFLLENQEFLFLAELHEGETLRRRDELCREAAASGHPAPLTTEELAAACRIAWRNNSRCIGRLHWKSLHVRDRRDVHTAEGIFESLVEHVVLAQADGRIRPVMTVFAPAERGGRAARIWNHQLFGYAGYKSADGEILGDPKNEPFTKLALELGWEAPSERTAFDLLPWVIAGADQRPRVVEFPGNLAGQIPIRHPHLAWFVDLGLKWYAVPVLSDMCFHVASTDFRAAPFNGWYMGTEIAARNLADVRRYNMLPLIAERMGLDTSRPASLWKDRALLELNAAVLHSYEQDGVRMVDHHTASEEFVRFLSMEKAAGREVSARWDWIVPPMSPATTPVFHMSMKETPGNPEFRIQEPAWEDGR